MQKNWTPFLQKKKVYCSHGETEHIFLSSQERFHPFEASNMAGIAHFWIGLVKTYPTISHSMSFVGKKSIFLKKNDFFGS